MSVAGIGIGIGLPIVLIAGIPLVVIVAGICSCGLPATHAVIAVIGIAVLAIAGVTPVIFVTSLLSTVLAGGCLLDSALASTILSSRGGQEACLCQTNIWGGGNRDPTGLKSKSSSKKKEIVSKVKEKE